MERRSVNGPPFGSTCRSTYPSVVSQHTFDDHIAELLVIQTATCRYRGGVALILSYVLGEYGTDLREWPQNRVVTLMHEKKDMEYLKALRKPSSGGPPPSLVHACKGVRYPCTTAR